MLAHHKEVQCPDAIYVPSYLAKRSHGYRPGGGRGRGWLLLVSWRYVGVEGGRRCALFLLRRRSSRCLKRRRRRSLVVLWFTSHRRKEGEEARGHCHLLPSQTKSQFSQALNSRAVQFSLAAGATQCLLLLLVLLCAPKVGIGFLLPG